MSALIASSVLRSCLGGGAATFAALLAGRSGCSPLRHLDTQRLRVAYGYHCDPVAYPYGPTRWLVECVRQAVAEADVNPHRQRVRCVVGSGLRELGSLEEADEPVGVPAHRMHFGDAVREAVPGVRDVVTLSNACSAGGHALALAQDMIELGDADVVLVGGTDAMTVSMLAMIGRMVDAPTDHVRPFDVDRRGVLLGEGAAAVAVVPDDGRVARGRLLSTGLSCDAEHLTAPSVDGISRAMRDALVRAEVRPSDVGLVLAHGTGTALNDPVECKALRQVLLAGGANPVVTGIKGAVGHMSGTAALANLDVALRCLETGQVPPTVGLRTPLAEAEGLRLVRDVPSPLPTGVVQVDAFGFGGVNAITLVSAA